MLTKKERVDIMAGQQELTDGEGWEKDRLLDAGDVELMRRAGWRFTVLRGKEQHISISGAALARWYRRTRAIAGSLAVYVFARMDPKVPRRMNIVFWSHNTDVF